MEQINCKNTLLITMLCLMLTFGIVGCGGGGANISEVKDQSYSVDITGVHPADSGITFGEAIENACPGGKWDQFNSGNGEIVEYLGGSSSSGEVDIQWVKGDYGWSVWAMEIDGSGISMAQINTFFSAAFSS